MIYLTLTLIVVLAVGLAWALIDRAEWKAKTEGWIRAYDSMDKYLSERLDLECERTNRLEEQLRELKKEKAPFVDEEEALPPEIARALAEYPPELAEPTRLWIRQQRRMRVDWALIRAKVMGTTTLLESGEPEAL